MIATATTAKTATALVNGDVVAAQDGYTLGVVMGQAGLWQGGSVVLWIDRADQALGEPHAIVRYTRDEQVRVFTVADWQAWNEAQA